MFAIEFLVAKIPNATRFFLFTKLGCSIRNRSIESRNNFVRQISSTIAASCVLKSPPRSFVRLARHSANAR